MLTKIITTLEEFNGLKFAWEKIELEDEDVTYYSSYSYLRSWWEEFRGDADKELFIICVYQGVDVIAIAPLMIERKKRGIIGWNELKFLGTGDFSSFLVSKGQTHESTILKRIFDEIDENQMKWDRLILNYISANSSLAYYLLKSPIYNKSFQLLVETPRLNFFKFESYDEMLRTFPKKINKLKNKLNKEVGYQFRMTNEIDEELYEKITKIHKQQQTFLVHEKNRKERRSLFANEKHHEFRKNTVVNNPNAWAFIIEGNNGDIISYNLAYLYKDVLYSWNSAYDPQYENYRLAKIRYDEIFKCLYEKRLAKVFDFGSGRYPWKFEWTDDFVSVYQLELWNSASSKIKVLEKIQKFRR